MIHALRDIIKHTPDLLSVRWKREGSILDHAARVGEETPSTCSVSKTAPQPGRQDPR
ncbi:hypothetical protein ACNKHO_06580 [Shigella flexneri]